MSGLATAAAVAALLGAWLIAGTFFAFSNFVMPALARLPAAQGVSAMQSINVVVLNALFLGVFTGTAVISLLLAILAAAQWESPAAAYVLAGALLYIVGVFLVTGLGNVPLNKRLAEADAADPATAALWAHYLKRWGALNTLRSLAAVAAGALLIGGLLR